MHAYILERCSKKSVVEQAVYVHGRIIGLLMHAYILYHLMELWHYGTMALWYLGVMVYALWFYGLRAHTPKTHLPHTSGMVWEQPLRHPQGPHTSSRATARPI